MIRKCLYVSLVLLLTPKVSQAIEQGYTSFKSSVTFNAAQIQKASSPTVLSTTTNNYAWGNKAVVRSSATVDLGITGFSGGRDGIVFTLFNVSTNTITIVNDSTDSSSGNRIATDTGSDVTIAGGDSRSFWYDAITLAWRIMR